MKTVIVQDPTLTTDVGVTNLVYKGAPSSVWRSFAAISTSTNGLKWNAFPPSPWSILDKHFYIAIPITITFTGNTGNATVPLLRPGVGDGFKAMPIATITSSMMFSCNTQQITVDTNQYMPYLARVSQKSKWENGIFSPFITYQDQFQAYAEAQRSLENPLGSYPDSSVPYQTKRGDALYNIISNTSTQAVITTVIFEPLWMSPFIFGEESKPGFTGLVNMSIDLNFVTNLSRIWSHDNTAPYAFTADPVVTIGLTGGTKLPSWYPTEPTLYIRTITPYKGLKPPSLYPDVTYHPYNQLAKYITETKTILAAGASLSSFVCNTPTIGFIPNRVFLLVRERDTDLTYATPQTFASIQGVTIDFNNVEGILSSASTFDLYNISRKNGYQASWLDWLGGSANFNSVGASSFGSILVLDFGDDIGLSNDYYPGMIGQFQLNVKISFQNVSNRPINFDVYIITAVCGQLVIANGTAGTTIGLPANFSPDGATTISLGSIKHNDFYGGGILDKIRQGANWAGKAYLFARPLLDSLAQLATRGGGLQYDMGNKRKRMSYDDQDVSMINDL